jgi:uncharacterized UBP type Zn finger protein
MELDMALGCSHLDQIKTERVRTRVCEECVLTGDPWVHLRSCLTCGHVGCCDSSPNRNASKHSHHTSHPLVRSAEPGEAWIWCYVDQIVPGELEA